MPTCIIRIYLPLKTNHTRVDDKVDPGHFDIQIMGTISVFEKTYVNPIVSYNGEGISIVNNGALPWENDYLLCTYSFEATTFSKLEKWLNDNCELAKEGEAYFRGIRDRYNVVKSEFVEYSKETHSCFAAVAHWVNDMGYPDLLNIYNQCTYPNGTDKPDENGFWGYTSWPMFENCYKLWAFKKLHAD